MISRNQPKQPNIIFFLTCGLKFSIESRVLRGQRCKICSTGMKNIQKRVPEVRGICFLLLTYYRLLSLASKIYREKFSNASFLLGTKPISKMKAIQMKEIKMRLGVRQSTRNEKSKRKVFDRGRVSFARNVDSLPSTAILRENDG